MKTLSAVAVLVVSVSAQAQIRVRVGIPVPRIRVAIPAPVIAVPVIPLPVIRFEAPPPLVEIEPGVQVVSEYGEEVFFTEGYYWHRRDGHWFRSHDHSGNWASVESHEVPGRLHGYSPGQYRNYRAPRAVEAPRQFAHSAPPSRPMEPPRPMMPHNAPPARPVAMAPHPAPAPMHRAPPPAPSRGRHR